MCIMKPSLKYTLAKYLEFRMCSELRVSNSITILRGFQIELWSFWMCWVWAPPLHVIKLYHVRDGEILKKKAFVIESKSSHNY